MMKFVVCIFLFCNGIVLAQNENYVVENLSLNNENPHFGLMRVADAVIVTSFQLDKKGRVKRVQGQPKLTIFQGEIKNSETIENLSTVQIDPKAGVPQITSATLSRDGSLIYITTVYTNKNKPNVRFKETNFHLEVGEFKAGVGFTNFKVLPFCKPRFSYAHPALSPDGKTLFFTANIKGGKATTKGGSDIFKVDILDGNTFSEPENLGSKVNSYGKEMFPFIASDNTLYFSSNRPNGFGGYDLYKCKINEDSTYEKAEKLEKPLNSVKDDLSLIMNANNTSGFLSSKRLGGKGDDDIYVFKMK
ncbi:TolB family protein [Algibacter lectus]|uniref:TolB family protein n=1 Tax=Algibacter lectus TaxID=221126 RepID=UPI002494DBB2|nr:hypothetical protein [Algibacter lectus]